MWVWFLAMVAVAADVEIAVGGPGEVRVSAASGSVHVPACRGVMWDLFNPETSEFEPAQAPVCSGIKNAIRIDATGRSFFVDVVLPALPDVGFHIVRPAVVFGTKCADKAPFALASCADVHVVRGPQMVIRNRGAAVPLEPPESL